MAIVNSRLKTVIFKSILLIASVVFFCEFVIYYLVIYKCDWPPVDTTKKSDFVDVMLLADTHILGRFKGHPLDKLRREWQMYRSFQTAVHLFRPKMVFVLGDLLDEGLWASPKDFNDYVDQFYQIFNVTEDVTLHLVVGNHDVGFHYWTDPYLNYRFEAAFNSSLVDVVKANNGVAFVTVNSMAMEGDGCDLCQEAEKRISEITKDTSIGRPVLLTHFPLYRSSDEICPEADLTDKERTKKFKSKIDCFSKEATELLLKTLKPRLVFTGHTHLRCVVDHPNHVKEWTVSSFNWRNNRQPSFLLARISPTDYAVSECFLPNEYIVFVIYIICALTLVCQLISVIRFIVVRPKVE